MLVTLLKDGATIILEHWYDIGVGDYQGQASGFECRCSVLVRIEEEITLYRNFLQYSIHLLRSGLVGSTTSTIASYVGVLTGIQLGRVRRAYAALYAHGYSYSYSSMYKCSNDPSDSGFVDSTSSDDDKPILHRRRSRLAHLDSTPIVFLSSNRQM